MRRLLPALLAVLCAAALAACSSCPDTGKVAAAAPVKHSRVYTPACPGGNYARPAGDEVYTPSDCNFLESLQQFKSVRAPWDSLLGNCDAAPGPVSLMPEPRVSAAPLAPTCDPAALPKDAKPGDVFCCTFVQPPAGPPLKVSEAREEWQRIECGPDSGECWTKVAVPPVFSAPPPPPGYWEWRLNPNCHVPTRAAAAPPCTPALAPAAKAAPVPDCGK